MALPDQAESVEFARIVTNKRMGAALANWMIVDIGEACPNIAMQLYQAYVMGNQKEPIYLTRIINGCPNFFIRLAKTYPSNTKIFDVLQSWRSRADKTDPLVRELLELHIADGTPETRMLELLAWLYSERRDAVTAGRLLDLWNTSSKVVSHKLIKGLAWASIGETTTLQKANIYPKEVQALTAVIKPLVPDNVHYYFTVWEEIQKVLLSIVALGKTITFEEHVALLSEVFPTKTSWGKYRQSFGYPMKFLESEAVVMRYKRAWGDSTRNLDLYKSCSIPARLLKSGTIPCSFVLYG